MPSDDLANLIERLRPLPAATVYEAAGKLGDMAPNIRPMLPGARLLGPAFTVKAMPSDNMVVFKAIAAAPEGSVLVIDAGDTDRSTIWGGTSTVASVARGLAGLVTNAAVRDMDEILASGWPVFAAGVAVRGTSKAHPGWIGIPVVVGGVNVNPGDIILADSDGVIVIPPARLAEIVPKAEEKRRDEIDKEDRLRRGESIASVMGF